MSKARIMGKWTLLSAGMMLSGAARLAGHEGASTHHSRVAEDIAEAVAKHEIVFTGKLIKDSLLPMPSKAVYPYYGIKRRLAFDVDTVLKGYRRESYTLDYVVYADTCEKKPFKFRVGCAYEVGIDRFGRGVGKRGGYPPFVSRAPDFKAKPYQVKGRDYLEIRTNSYLKPVGSDSLCQEQPSPADP